MLNLLPSLFMHPSLHTLTPPTGCAALTQRCNVPTQSFPVQRGIISIQVPSLSV